MEFNPFSLKDKVILVTGASSGIGKQIAISCSKMGAHLVITARNKKRLEDTLSLLAGNGHLILVGDLTSSEDMDRIVENLPNLDGIVHCAGIGNRVPCKSIRQSDIEEVFKVNFESPTVLQAKILSQKKIKKESSIVFIASRAASFPSVGNAIYSASKGAMISYSKCLALELSNRKIRVNCICPAMVWTDLIVNESVSAEDLEKSQMKYPLKRFGKPEDIANLSIYLLSDASSWMTGSCIDISGGGEGVLI